MGLWRKFPTHSQYIVDSLLWLVISRSLDRFLGLFFANLKGMEPSTSSSNGSEEITTETFHFSEDIQSLMTENVLQPSFDSPPEHESSFTTLVGLLANQSLKLLRKPESSDPPEIPSGDIWRNQTSVPSSVPTFPSNAGAARFSVFARESPATSSDPSISTRNSPKLKTEPADSDSNPNSSLNFWGSVVQINGRRRKRKEAEKGKVKTPAKRSKSDEDEKLKKKRGEQEHKESEKLPCVHVRALRGQATDNHSLAERARREKINARMKPLQELVPVCSKISGTALVLDEIINHVQSLQRQIEGCSLMAGCLAGMMAEDPLYPDLHFNTLRRRLQQLQQHVDVVPLSSWERADCFVNISSESDLDSAYSVSLHLNQLKMEL